MEVQTSYQVKDDVRVGRMRSVGKTWRQKGRLIIRQAELLRTAHRTACSCRIPPTSAHHANVFRYKISNIASKLENIENLGKSPI